MGRPWNPENVGKSPAKRKDSRNAKRREQHAKATAGKPKQKQGGKQSSELQDMNDKECEQTRSHKRTKACCNENMAFEDTWRAKLELKNEKLELERNVKSNRLQHMKGACIEMHDNGLERMKEALLGGIGRRYETPALQSGTSTPVSLVDEPPEPKVVDLADEPTVHVPQVKCKLESEKCRRPNPSPI